MFSQKFLKKFNKMINGNDNIHLYKIANNKMLFALGDGTVETKILVIYYRYNNKIICLVAIDGSTYKIHSDFDTENINAIIDFSDKDNPEILVELDEFFTEYETENEKENYDPNSLIIFCENEEFAEVIIFNSIAPKNLSRLVFDKKNRMSVRSFIVNTFIMNLPNYEKATEVFEKMF